MVESNNAINNTVGASISGVTNTLTVTNPSNTASSAARTTITVGGSSAADPTLNFNVSGVTDWEMGVDNSDSDSFKLSASTALGTTDTFVMTTAGERTMPLQPAFEAQGTVAQTNVTGDGTPYFVIYQTALNNVSSSYNNATGAFTAPVTGNYVFNACATVTGLTSAHTTGKIHFTKNGAQWGSAFRGNYYAISDAGGNMNISLSSVMYLTALDVVRVLLTVSSGAKVVSVGTDITFFSGYLLG